MHTISLTAHISQKAYKRTYACGEILLQDRREIVSSYLRMQIVICEDSNFSSILPNQARWQNSGLAEVLYMLFSYFSVTIIIYLLL